MKKIFLFIILIFLTFEIAQAKKVFVCSIHPVSAILKELTGVNANIKTIASEGASPHTYSLKPSDIMKVNVSDGFFYVGGKLDPWAEAIDSENKFALLELIPEEALMKYSIDDAHDHGDDEKEHQHSEFENIDPHFWLNPMTVSMLIPSLRDKLIELDPENANNYLSNATAFENKLKFTHSKIEKMLLNLRGKPVFQFHPSFNYFIKEFRLLNAGVIQKIPGSDPSVKETADLITKIKKSGTKAIFTEPQLPKSSAKMIAKEAGVSLYELDPLGGTKGRERYTDLIMFNAEIFKKAL